MRCTILVASLAVAGCGGAEQTVVEPEATDPGPERILYRDIEEHELFGASCAFAPGGGIGAIAIAMQDGGFIKFEGEVVRLPPYGEGHSLNPPEINYSGENYAFSLKLDAESERPREDGGREFDAQLQVRARDGSTVYEENGLAQCGA